MNPNGQELEQLPDRYIVLKDTAVLNRCERTRSQCRAALRLECGIVSGEIEKLSFPVMIN